MQITGMRGLLMALVVSGLCAVGLFDSGSDAVGLTPLVVKSAVAAESKPAAPKSSQVKSSPKDKKVKSDVQKKKESPKQSAKPADAVAKTRLLNVIKSALTQIEKNHAEVLNYELLLRGALDGMIKAIDKNAQVISTGKPHTKQKPIPLEAKIVNPDSEPLAEKLRKALGAKRKELKVSEKAGDTVRNAYKLLGGNDAALAKIAEALDIPKDVRRRINAYCDFAERFQLGYIRIGSLTSRIPDDIEEALKQFEQEKVRALILDLRDSPGGELPAAVAAADKFISHGEIVTVKEFNGKEVTYKAKKEGTHAGRPMIVIINSRTTAEAEVIAGALKDRRAIIIGERSAGRAGFRRDLPIEGSNLRLRLIAGEYQLPFRHGFNGEGIEPNITISETVIDGPSANDAYANRAKQILKGILKLKGNRD